MKDFEVEIKGIVPLMHDRYPINALDTTKKKRRGTVFNPKEEMEKCLYRNSKGEIYQPSNHIEGALIKAGSTLVIPGAGRKTYKDLMKTNIAILPTEIMFENRNKYELDLRKCVVPATKGAIPVARPIWKDWGAKFILRMFDETLIPKETMRSILETAGKEQGIGTYRPIFGRFEVIRFEEK